MPEVTPSTPSTPSKPGTASTPNAESRRPTTPLEKARAAVQARAAADPGTTTAERRTPGAGTVHSSGNGHASPLLPADESDELGSRMQHAVVGFVDGPRDAVAEADHVLEELTTRFTDAVNQRRRTLRGSWQSADTGGKGEAATTADTEQLRLALRDYRELTERLLHI